MSGIRRNEELHRVQAVSAESFRVRAIDTDLEHPAGHSQFMHGSGDFASQLRGCLLPPTAETLGRLAITGLRFRQFLRSTPVVCRELPTVQ